MEDAFLDRLDALSAAETRTVLLLLRSVFEYDQENARWTVDRSYRTVADLLSAPDGEAGITRRAVTDALPALEREGWITATRREGQATRIRWSRGVPQERYTQIPLLLLDDHARLSHSAVKVVLRIYRETWGWTRTEDGETQHRTSRTLSAEDLADATGLHPRTVRSVTQELAEKEAITRTRSHHAEAWTYRPDLSFFNPHLERSAPHTSREDKFNRIPTPTRETPPSEKCHTGEDRSAIPVPGRADLDEGKRQHYDRLKSEGMDPDQAGKLCRKRSQEHLKRTLFEFDRRRQDVDDPPAWLHAAISQNWFAPRTHETPVNRSRSGSTGGGSTAKPMGQVFEDLLSTEEGWETRHKGNESRLSGEDQRRRGADEPQDHEGNGKDAETNPQDARSVGVPHSEILRMTDVLRIGRTTPGDWICRTRSNAPNLFLPDETRAAHLRAHKGHLEDEQARAAVETLLSERQRFEEMKAERK